MTLFFSHKILLANEIAAMKHWCCYSKDADVAKIDFMYFNPGYAILSLKLAAPDSSKDSFLTVKQVKQIVDELKLSFFPMSAFASHAAASSL